MFRQIKSLFFNRALRRIHKPKGTIKPQFPFESIGIIYDGSLSENTALIREFIQQLHLKNKKVFALAYHKKKPSDHNEKKDLILSFSQKDINWYGIPHSDSIDTFTARKYDILISKTKIDEKPIQYIINTCNYGFLVGSSDSADIFINHSSENLKLFLQKTMLILSELNLAHKDLFYMG